MSGILHPPPSDHELELLSFLKAENWQARQVALANLAGFSARGHPRRGLLLLDGTKSGQPDVIADLKQLTMDLTPTAHDAFSCLINLSDSILVSRRIASPDYLSFLVTYIFHPSSLLADLASMLLSNLTKLESAAKTLTELKMPGSSLGMGADDELTALELLLAAFEQGGTVKTSTSSAAIEEMKKRALASDPAGHSSSNAKAAVEGVNGEAAQGNEERKSHCNFLASVFANVTVLPAGREFFTTPLAATDVSTMPAGRLFPYTEHPDLIRRGGVISSLKNILFVKSAHGALIAPPSNGADLEPPLVRPPNATVTPLATRDDDSESTSANELDILPCLLLPLCNDRLFDGLDDEEQLSLPDELQFLEEGKKVERDPALRAMLIESLLLLGSTLYGRRCMRERGVYLVVRELHKSEDAAAAAASSDERIGESILRLVNILKREESAATLADAEDTGEEGNGDTGDGQKSADQRAIDEIIGAEKVDDGRQGAVAAAANGGDSDDDDLIIEEL